MTNEGLGFLNGKLSEIIPYEFMEWSSSPIPDPYWVGQYSEIPSVDEGGEFESDFLLIGTTKKKYLDLESVKDQVREMFPEYGLTEILSNGWGIMVAYDTASPIPSIEEGIHRIQITLKVKEWKGE
jgi:hypothetical protein